MDVHEKLELIKATYTPQELDQILAKLLDAALSEQRLRLERYRRDLSEFEQRYAMDSATFHARFQAGELGDEMDFFEWAGLYQLFQDTLQKIGSLELAA